MLEVITDNLDVWTTAKKQKKAVGRGRAKKDESYGIKKLRELILELAVRGKLVPQDASDEPASVLLEKIAKEKQRLIEEGKIRKFKELSEINEQDELWVLPQGWEFVRFGNVTFNRDAERIPLSVSERSGRRGKYDYYGASGVIDTIDKYLFEKDLLLIGEDGANLINRSTPIAFMARGKYWVNNHAHVIDGISEELLLYICLHINAISLEQYVTGTAQPKMNQTKMNSIILALPPLAEQHRIVAKVDELMALCDQLEQEQADHQATHQKLVETLLNGLIESATLRQAHDEQNNAKYPELVEGQNTADYFNQLIAEHFDTLFTTEQSIEKLKQTILQLAVMGKLVPQDPNDEPASVLLGKIAKEKAKLIEEGQIKKQKALPEIGEDEKPFELPNEWEWSRLPDIGELARGKSKHRPRNSPALYDGGQIPLVQTGDVARADPEILTYTAKYNEVGLEQSRLWYKGTLCITIAANIADTGILSFDACFPDSIVGFNSFEANMDVAYFDYFIRTAKNHLEDFAPATAQKNINLAILGNLLVPLPPLNELNHIVSKVSQLLTLCDSLKANLSQAQTTQTQLADAIVKQAVN